MHFRWAVGPRAEPHKRLYKLPWRQTRNISIACHSLAQPQLYCIRAFDPSKWVLCLKLLPPDSSLHLRVSVVSRDSPVVETDCPREIEGRVDDSKVFQVWSSSFTVHSSRSHHFPQYRQSFSYALAATTLVHYLLSVSRAPVFFKFKQTTRLNIHKINIHQPTSKCRTLFPRSWLRPL
jgi:hypothetical protein